MNNSMSAQHTPGHTIYADPKVSHQELTAEQRAIMEAVPIAEFHPWVQHAGRWFRSHVDAAVQLRYEARLRAANAKQVERFGPMRSAQMRREASTLYAGVRAARAAIAKATGSAP